MRSGVTPDSALRMQFRTPGVRLLVAGLCVNIRSDVSAVIEQFLQMYVGHKLEAGAGSDDFRIDISYTDPLQRLLRRRTRLLIEDDAPFHPLPHRLAYILIEAGLNWCISATASNVVLHAGVVERGGVAVVLPAPSGSGKSTLCAALVTSAPMTRTSFARRVAIRRTIFGIRSLKPKKIPVAKSAMRAIFWPTIVKEGATAGFKKAYSCPYHSGQSARFSLLG